MMRFTVSILLIALVLIHSTDASHSHHDEEHDEKHEEVMTKQETFISNQDNHETKEETFIANQDNEKTKEETYIENQAPDAHHSSHDSHEKEKKESKELKEKSKEKKSKEIKSADKSKDKKSKDKSTEKSKEKKTKDVSSESGDYLGIGNGGDDSAIHGSYSCEGLQDISIEVYVAHGQVIVIQRILCSTLLIL